nr:PAC2 family protein [Corynebacterium mendelii]
MYELAYPAPQFDGPSTGRTLVIALQGYADAGQAVDMAAKHLIHALDNKDVAVFNVDELIDYRSRRPTVTMDNAAVTGMDDLSLTVKMLTDSDGKPFLLLSGPEPDMRWNAFSRAVADLVERFDISQTVCLYSAAMSVPHTRPMVLSAHGNIPKMTERHFRMDSGLTLPGSAALTIEHILTGLGRAVGGYTTHVPHYIAANEYPEAVLRLLNAVSLVGDLNLPLKSLEKDTATFRAQITENIEQFPDIQQMLTPLEEQYDQELERYRTEHPGAIMPGEGGVPSADQIGEELEKFLAELQSAPPDQDQTATVDTDSGSDAADTPPQIATDCTTGDAAADGAQPRPEHTAADTSGKTDSGTDNLDPAETDGDTADEDSPDPDNGKFDPNRWFKGFFRKP